MNTGSGQLSSRLVVEECKVPRPHPAVLQNLQSSQAAWSQKMQSSWAAPLGVVEICKVPRSHMSKWQQFAKFLGRTRLVLEICKVPGLHTPVVKICKFPDRICPGWNSLQNFPDRTRLLVGSVSGLAQAALLVRVYKVPRPHPPSRKKCKVPGPHPCGSW